MDRFRFLTAGESHGPTLGAIVEGVPAGLALTEDDIEVDLARRQRGYGRGARQTIEQDRARILSGVRHGRRSARRSCSSSRTATGRTGPGHAGRAADRGARGGARRARGRGQQARDRRSPASGRATPTSRRRSSTASTTSATRSSARPRARPRRGSPRRDRPGVPARARDRGLVVHRGGRRRGARPGAGHPVARRGRRLAAALPGPRGRGRDDRAGRRGALGGRHGRRRVRGRRPRGADRARQPRPLGPAPGRARWPRP